MPPNGLFAPAPGGPPRPGGVGGWLLLLGGLLTIGEPLGFAPMVTRLLSTIGDRGPAVIALLVVRIAITAFGIAAGIALLGRRPHAAGMAMIALVLLAAVSLVSLLTPILPTNLPPGMGGPTAVVVATYYGAWLAYLQRSRRARQTFD